MIGDQLSLVVRPTARGAGIAAALLADVPGRRRPVSAWSHGDHPAAAALARPPRASSGCAPLWVMRRPTSDAAARARRARGLTDPRLPRRRCRRRAPGQRGGVRPPPRAGRDGRGRAGRADGRGVVRPGRAAHRRRTATRRARLPLDQAALPRARRGVRRRHRPGAPRAAASASCSPSPASTTSRPRRRRDPALRRVRQRAGRRGLRRPRLPPRRRRHARAVPRRPCTRGTLGG